VKIKLKGTTIDEKLNKEFKSKTVKDNGFNPFWGVYGEDSKGNIISHIVKLIRLFNNIKF